MPYDAMQHSLPHRHAVHPHRHHALYQSISPLRAVDLSNRKYARSDNAFFHRDLIDALLQMQPQYSLQSVGTGFLASEDISSNIADVEISQSNAVSATPELRPESFGISSRATKSVPIRSSKKTLPSTYFTSERALIFEHAFDPKIRSKHYVITLPSPPQSISRRGPFIRIVCGLFYFDVVDPVLIHAISLGQAFWLTSPEAMPKPLLLPRSQSYFSKR